MYIRTLTLKRKNPTEDYPDINQDLVDLKQQYIISGKIKDWIRSRIDQNTFQEITIYESKEAHDEFRNEQIVIDNWNNVAVKLFDITVEEKTV